MTPIRWTPTLLLHAVYHYTRLKNYRLTAQALGFPADKRHAMRVRNAVTRHLAKEAHA